MGRVNHNTKMYVQDLNLFHLSFRCLCVFQLHLITTVQSQNKSKTNHSKPTLLFNTQLLLSSAKGKILMNILYQQAEYLSHLCMYVHPYSVYTRMHFVVLHTQSTKHAQIATTHDDDDDNGRVISVMIP